ncbi:uncharacterized protein [Argopecten irradians]|uniref:uncharacterized protein isoform X2 n=1 Tax=Argopecten irradians TaxID=31199 RepID=UPI00370F76D7
MSMTYLNMSSKVIMHRPYLFCRNTVGCSKWIWKDKSMMIPTPLTILLNRLHVNQTLCNENHTASRDVVWSRKQGRRLKILLSKLIREGHPLEVHELISTLQEKKLYNEKLFPYFLLKMTKDQSLETIEDILRDLDCTKFDIPELSILISFYDRHDAEDLVLSTYERMCEISDGVFDHSTLKVVTKALSRTSKWRECFRLTDLYLIVRADVPKTFDYVLAAAAKEEDFQTFCDVLVKVENVLKSDTRSTDQALPLCFGAFVDPYLAALERGVKHFSFENLFYLMRKYKFFVNETCIPPLVASLGSPFFKNTEVNRWNQLPSCEVCNSPLNSHKLTVEEFHGLRDSYFSQDGVNVYLKNNPAESKSLERLIRTKGPFDVVVDHLNLCFEGGNMMPHLSVSILQQLKRRGLHCLVITRKKFYRAFKAHLKKELEKCAIVFISDSESLDDLIVFDATFYNGMDTMLLSNDKFHDHACLLGSKMQQVFWRWQRCRQILRFHTSREVIHLNFPESPDVFVQESDHGWHIPYGTNTFQFPDKKILCVRRNKGMQDGKCITK